MAYDFVIEQSIKHKEFGELKVRLSIWFLRIL